MRSLGKRTLTQEQQEGDESSSMAISYHKENHFPYVVKLSVKLVCMVDFILLCCVMLCSENESKCQLPCMGILIHNLNRFPYVVQPKGRG